MDRCPVAASLNIVKDCLASWLHSADTEAIACTSKVIDGRIYDARKFILGNPSRRLRGMSQVDFAPEQPGREFFLNVCPNLVPQAWYSD
jgi:hypothetical protein